VLSEGAKSPNEVLVFRDHGEAFKLLEEQEIDQMGGRNVDEFW
jgi:hypothetical protein